MAQAFQGWCVLVTGASAGLGAEFSRQLAKEVDTLILVARRQDRLEKLQSELQRRHPKLRVELAVADLSVPDQMVQLLNWLAEKHLSVDLLVNNAGLGDYGLFEKTPWEKLDQMMMVNMVALSALSRYVLPEMIGRGRGAIINISSIASFIPIPTFSVYAATKAYVTSFTEGLALELKGTGVTVTAICPGPVETEFSKVAQRGEENRLLQTPPWMEIDAELAVQESLQAAREGRPRWVPGWRVRWGTAFMRMVPMVALRWYYEVTYGKPLLAERRAA
jgi:short-subunit dehydrogenase